MKVIFAEIHLYLTRFLRVSLFFLLVAPEYEAASSCRVLQALAELLRVIELLPNLSSPRV